MIRDRQPHPFRNVLITLGLGVILGLGVVVYADWRATLHSPPVGVSLPPTPRPGSTATAAPPLLPTLLIPTANVYAPIVEVYFGDQGWEVANLGENIGHLQGTDWIDAPGNIVLAGHVELADGRAGVFAHIGEVEVNDPLFLRLGDMERRYRVTEVRTVSPDDMSVIYPTPDDRLTLITCADYDFSQNTYRVRVVVIAERAS